MRTIRALVVTLVVVAVLTGCTVAPEWAIRLNADGTVDYLSCSSELDSISVDYWRSSEDWNGIVEWEAQIAPTPVGDSGTTASPVDVARYGEIPDSWEGDPALEPVAGWEWVAVGAGAGAIAREELTVGEWHWELTSTWAWIPEHPCDGWVVGADGEPRRAP